MNFIDPNVLRLTSDGSSALARSVAGETLSLTRIGIGDGVEQSSGGDGSGEIIGGGIFFPTDPTTPIPITGMVHERVSVDIETSKREGNTLVVSGSIPFPSETHGGAQNQAPFPWVETGLFGKFGEEAEILVAYCKDENGETLDLDSDAVEREIYISMVFDADANIKITLFPRSEIDWEKVSGKPEKFTPADHQHSVSDIASGVLPMGRGGLGVGPSSFAHGDILYASKPPLTGATPMKVQGVSPAELRKRIGALGALPVQILELLASDWEGTGPWTQSMGFIKEGVDSDIEVAGAVARITPILPADAAARALYEEAYRCLDAEVTCTGNYYTFTCSKAKPTIDFDVRLEGYLP